MDILISVLKTLFFYFLVVFSYRIMGKREIGELGIIDLIVSILIAELVAISIENLDSNLLLTVIPIISLVILEIALGYLSLKSRKIRNLLGGKPSLIICNGKINYKEIVKQRYNMDDLLLQLRQNEVRNIEEVEYAFLEYNGKLSVFKYKPFKIKTAYPMPIILDGEIQDSSLKILHKTKTWLINELDKKNTSVKEIFYAFYKKNKLYIIKKINII